MLIKCGTPDVVQKHRAPALREEITRRHHTRSNNSKQEQTHDGRGEQGGVADNLQPSTEAGEKRTLTARRKEGDARVRSTWRKREQRGGQLTIDNLLCDGGWRRRTRRWPKLSDVRSGEGHWLSLLNATQHCLLSASLKRCCCCWLMMRLRG
jgi:hypothetical protein